MYMDLDHTISHFLFLESGTFESTYVVFPSPCYEQPGHLNLYIFCCAEQVSSVPVLRTLQTGDPRWDMEGPELEWSGFRLKIDYLIRDSVPDQSIRVGVFSDGQCSKDITVNDYMQVNVNPDPSGDGSGFKNLRVGVLLNPLEIGSSPIISYDSDGQAD